MTSRARLALATLALLALVAVAYAPLRDGVFVWDDHALIETNPTVEHGTLREIFLQPFWAANPLSDAHPPYYRPVAMLTLRADYGIAGPDAPSFHFSNLLLHLLTTIVVILVARRFGAGPIASVLSAAVWALLPRNSEAVAWISGRADLLATLAVIVAIGVWPWYAEPDDGDARGDRRRLGSERIRAGIAGLAVLIGLLSKEVAIAAVAGITVATALAALRGRRTRPSTPTGVTSRLARRLLWIAVPVAVYVALRSFATRGVVTSHLAPLGVGLRAATVLEAVGRYVEMTFDAWHPASSIGLVGAIDTGSVVLGVLAIAAVALFVARAVRRERTARHAVRPELVALVVTGLVSIGLVVHLIPITLASAVAADRLLYLPLASLTLAAVVAGSRASTSAPRYAVIVGGVLVALLVASFATVTRARTADYTNELRFRVVGAETAHPSNTSMKSGLANLLRAEVATALACKLHASVRKTLERTHQTTSQRYIRALENLGSCYAEVGRYAEAAESYGAAERLQPNHARIHMDLGYLRLHTFDIDGAGVELRRALELAPELAAARATLAALPALRAALARFATEKARLDDPVAWARFLSSVGRVPDATAAWAAVMMTPRVDADVAWEGFEHLLPNADIETLKRTVVAGIDAWPADDIVSKVVRRRLAHRVLRAAQIEALRLRIEALASTEDGR